MEDYTVDYFIEKFEKIPEDKWGIKRLTDDMGNHCALGHCKVVENTQPTSEAISLAGILLPLSETTLSITVERDWYFIVYPINDGHHTNYQQPTPKQRILAALYDIKKMQAPQEAQENKTEIREVIRYVSVPETIKEQSKELILQ